ncbi:hypothetical protein HPQ64_04255 [Rhizobiales bacterium]|uniref:hypothetical protein n=1 Tax=Hongsoonwoonella zoysiae TaxID=2821844 RepID=UPI00156001C5|nr:hypothetical protein [Hongsoonwoonella zoysiae]NRG16899.1 hypothetical protein [Hongsoonwoonella zoysiae]
MLNFDQEDGIAHLHDKNWFPSLGDVNDRIVENYGFEDRDRHFRYLAEAAFIIQGYSGIRIDGRFVTVPSDLTPYKEAAAKFQKAIQKVDELSAAIFDIRSDATADTLLAHFDPKRETSALMKMLGQAMHILVQIEQLEGRVGNRPIPDWLEAFCVHSQRFWHSEKGGGTRIIFEAERQTRITPWVEDVYVSLTKRLNVDVPLSRLKGVARNVPAYRPETEPNNGDAG